MVKEETVKGIRIDTFLVNSDAVSEEPLKVYRTQKEEKKVCEDLLSLLTHKNRLPD